MSGLVGFWNLDGRPADPRVLSHMSAVLGHRGPDGEGQAVSGPVGLACQHFWVTPEEVGEIQPCGGRRGALLVFDGRVDNRDPLLARLELPRTSSDATCVMRAYEFWGEAAVQQIDGDFTLALYDPARRLLLLARDPMGLRPIYYHAGPRVLAFASEIKALLRHPEIPARPDDEGIADHLLLGARPVDRLEVTCFAGIWALPPAHCLVVSPERRTQPVRYWDFDPGHRIRCSSFGEYAEAFQERFAEAVRRRIRSAYPVAISVSGGLDSSSIFCQAETLRRAGLGPTLVGLSYTGVEGSTSDEREYLGEIERQYGVMFERIPLAPLVGMAQGGEREVWCTETPMLDSLWQITEALERAAAARGARRFLSGHWGDQMMFSTAYLVDLFREFRWKTLGRHLQRFREWFDPLHARDLRRQALLELLRSYVPAPLVPPLKWLRRRLAPGARPQHWLATAFRRQSLRGTHRPATIGVRFRSAQARALYREARTKYAGHCMEWNNKVSAWHGLDHAFPFLDRDLVSFLLATPGEVHAWNGVPRALLRAGLAGVVPARIRERRWKADFTEPVNRGAAQDLSVVSGLLASHPRSVALGYVDRNRLTRQLDGLAHRLRDADDCLASWELADFLGLESLLRVFFSEKAVTFPSATMMQEAS